MIVAFLIGIAFGWTLERAGLASARKLTGQFYLTDFTVFKVMFTAILVAMLGAFWLSRFGVLDLGRVHVPETWLVPQLVGGAIFGIGFVVAGLCPGTSCVSAATGRGDGAMVVAGMFGGVAVASLGMAPLRALYESTARGALTLPAVLGMPYGVVVLGVVLVALAGFVAAEKIERHKEGTAAVTGGWVGGVSPPTESVTLSDQPAGTPAVPSGRRRAAVAAIAVLCALPAAFSPRAAGIDVDALARQVAREEDHVTALELAAWIKDRKPGLRILDLRTRNEFETARVPGAELVAIESIAKLPVRTEETLVLISDGGAHAAQAWVFLRALGHPHVYFLRGGMGEWNDDVLQAKNSTAVTRYFRRGGC